MRGWGFVGNDADRRSLICIAEANGNPLLICFIKSMVSLLKTILLRGIVTQQEGHQDGIDTVRKFLILMQIGKRCKKDGPQGIFTARLSFCYIGCSGRLFLDAAPELIHCSLEPFIIQKLFIILILQQTLKEHNCPAGYS